MSQLMLPTDYVSIKLALKDEQARVAAFFDAIAADQYFAAPADVWSPAEHQIHLFKSSSPLVTAFNLPKLGLRARFGKAKQASRDYATVVAVYQAALADGAAASGPFLPQVRGETAAERQHIATKWNQVGKKLLAALDKWDDAALDAYQLPHPVLGTMTVREMLYFTIYHNLHHVRDVQRLLGEPEADWLP